MRVFLVVLAIYLTTSQVNEDGVFRPFEQPGYRHVNAHQFSPDGATLYLALFPERVAAAKGLPAPERAPEVSIYVSSLNDDGSWSPPETISFAGPYKDYEPTLAPAGELMLFNSWRPMPDGREVTNDKNNLWLTRRHQDGGWTEPVLLEGASRWETEESYPAITADHHVYYCQETVDAGGRTTGYDIFVGRIDGNRLVEIEPFAPGATDAGECDPWVSADGSTVVFTRWDRDGDWSTTVDLYVTHRRDDIWTEAVSFPDNLPEGPDYSPAAGADGATFVWRQGGDIKTIPMHRLLERSTN